MRQLEQDVVVKTLELDLQNLMTGECSDWKLINLDEQGVHRPSEYLGWLASSSCYGQFLRARAGIVGRHMFITALVHLGIVHIARLH